MKASCTVLIVVVVIAEIIAVPNRPPSIYLQPDFDVYYKEGESVQLQCEANSVPNPRYNWTRNGRRFDTSGNDNRMVMLMDSGTIVMNKPQAKDEGIFQCLAYNHLGVSTSINVNFRQAMLKDFPGGRDQYVPVERGHSIMLRCVPPTSIPRASITWHIRDPKTSMTKAINFDNRVTMDLEGRLYITNVQDEDYQNGKPYICMATNYMIRKNTIAPGIILTEIGSKTPINVAPHYLWSTPNEIFGILGQPLRIKCIFGGSPTPEVHWENKTGNIPDNRRTLSLGGQELSISSLTMEDRGQYTCYTTSPMGQRQQRTINVIVKSKPYWLEGGEPQDIETSVGARATFICKAGGDPTPDIQWYINGVKFKDAKHITIQEGRLMKPDNHNITIVDLRIGDAMVLQCNASNTFGYVFADFYLNVLKERPQFISRPKKELKVAENTDVYLTCRTSGKPDPIITWYKGNQQITGGRYQTQPNGDLLIQKLVLSDAGNFTCVARNDEGMDADWGVMIVRRATRIEQKPRDLEVFARTDAKFTCSGTTDFEEVANLRVLWLKDMKEISFANQRMTTNVQDNSLTISGSIARDSGFYTCVVTNGLDEQRASAILTVKDKPEPPLDVRTKDCSNNTVKLLWTKGGFNNAPIQYFTIQYNTSIEPDSWVHAGSANQSANTATIQLRPGVTYSFRVIATNKIGESEPSKHSDYCTTSPSKPFKNPENVRGIGDKPSYLVIEWTPMPPIDQGGRDFRYILRVTRRGNVQFDQVSTISNWRQNRFELLTNDIYTPYNVTIEAYNEFKNSASKLETTVIYSAESKPDPSAKVDEFVVDVAALDENSATFYWAWDMSNNDRLNGKFRGFKIQYWVKNMKKVTFREDEILAKDLVPRYGSIQKRATTEFRYTLTNLLPYTYMEAQICVMNTYYVSGPSPLVSFVTKVGVPGPVENMRPTIIGSNFIELTWEQPELLNSPMDLLTTAYLNGYDIGFQTVKGLDLGKMQEMDPQIVDPRINKAVLNGLTSNTRYRVHMWARTAGGRGEVSFMEITTAKSAGLAVPAFNIINVNQTFFNLTWTMMIDRKHGTVAFAQYRVKGTSDWQQTPQEVSKSWIGIGKLMSGTSYEVRLAVTNGGQSSKSDITVIKTTGLSAAFSLGGNIAWFIGLILSVLVIIALAILVVMMFRRKPEPEVRAYTAPPRKPKQYDDQGSRLDKRSGSLNKGYDNSTYSDEDKSRFRDEYGDGDDRYPKGYDKGYDNDDGNRDDYDDRNYDYDNQYNYEDYDRYDDRDDDRRYSDGKRYDDENRRYSDGKRYDDDENRRYSYDNRYNDGYDGGRKTDRRPRYSDEYDDEDEYGDEKTYKTEPRRTNYDRTPSYERQASANEDVDLQEPAKFDEDGYPVNSTPSSGGNKSSFV